MSSIAERVTAMSNHLDRLQEIERQTEAGQRRVKLWASGRLYGGQWAKYGPYIGPYWVTARALIDDVSDAFGLHDNTELFEDAIALEHLLGSMEIALQFNDDSWAVRCQTYKRQVVRDGSRGPSSEGGE